MNILSISIVVPTKSCINSCKFCVSRMHENNYENSFNSFQIRKRIKWAINNNINSCIITGTGEALQNNSFLTNLSSIFHDLDYPFPNIELQTSGVLLTNKSPHPIHKELITYDNIDLLRKLGVNTISLSVSDLFNDENNMDIMGVHHSLKFKLSELCHFIKDEGFNLRICINLTRIYDQLDMYQILNRLKELKCDQLTFRKLYSSKEDNEQSKWVKENSCYFKIVDIFNAFIKHNGTPLYKLPYGSIVYSFNGISTVLDDNCMNKNNNDLENLKYVILRENGKLYCQWDDEGSLIF